MKRFGVKTYLVYISEYVLAALIWTPSAFAQSGPSSLNLSGGLYNSNGTAIVNTNINFKIQIYDKGGTCLLYAEQFLGLDLSQTNGAFSLQIGGGTSRINNVDSSMNFNNKVFQNPGGTVAVTGCTGGVVLATGDNRLVRISYDLGSGFVAMTPDVPITSAPYAMVAETLQGKVPTDFIQVRNDVNYQLTQVNAEYLFGTLKYPILKALVDGTSSQYIVSSPTAAVSFNSQRLTSVSDPTSAQDAATKNYSDTNLGGKTLDVTGVGAGVGGGKTLLWDQVAGKWYAAAGSGFLNGGNTFGANSSLGNKDNFKLSFVTNNIPAMTIDTTGNVGIGTALPAAHLHVVGTESHGWDGGAVFDTANTTGPSAYGTTWNWTSGIGLRNTTGQSGAGAGINFTALNGHPSYQSMAGIYAIPTNIDGTGLDGSLIFTTNTKALANAGNLERMRIDSAGNVGIGTTSSSYPLQVNGTANATTFLMNGSASAEAAKVTNAAEAVSVSATAATGTVNFYVASGAVQYYTTNASANWTLNWAWSAGTTLNAAMAANDSITTVFLVTQGATAYYPNAFTIDGTSVTPLWQGGVAPTTGDASSIDAYTCTIIKTASAAYTVLCAVTQYK